MDNPISMIVYLSLFAIIAFAAVWLLKSNKLNKFGTEIAHLTVPGTQLIFNDASSYSSDTMPSLSKPDGLYSLYSSKYGPHFGSHIFRSGTILEVFLSKLTQKFTSKDFIFSASTPDEVIIHTKVTNLIDGKSHIGYVGTWARKVPLKKLQSTNVILNPNYKRGNYIHQEGDEDPWVWMVSKVILVYPDPSFPDNSIKIANISDLLASNKVDYKPFNAGVIGNTFTLGKKGVDWYLTSQPIPPKWLLTDSHLEVTYPRISVNYQEEVSLWPTEKLQHLLERSVANLKNVSIGGDPRTGKTTLSQHIVALVAQNKEARVIHANAQTILAMGNSDFNWDILQDTSKPNMINVLYIEQAETVMKENTSFFLSLTDGAQSREHRLVVIFVYNGNKDEFDRAIFGPGRTLDIQLSLMTVEEAKNKAKELSTLNEPGFVFQKERFDAFIKKQNKDAKIPVGTVYTFYVANDMDMLEEYIAKYKKEHTIAPQPKTAPLNVLTKEKLPTVGETKKQESKPALPVATTAVRTNNIKKLQPRQTKP